MSGRTPSAAGLGEYPRRYDVRALPERRQRAAFRFLSWMCALAGLLNVAAAGAALAILPAKAASPVLAVYGADGVKGVDAPAYWVSGSTAYVERLAIDYVKARHLVTADRGEMQRVWSAGGVLASLESRDALGLASALSKPQADEIAAALRTGASAEASFVASKELVPGEVYGVDFNVVRKDPSGNISEVEELRAVIEIGFDPAAGGTLANPLGFQVLAYSDAPRRGL